MKRKQFLTICLLVGLCSFSLMGCNNQTMENMNTENATNTTQQSSTIESIYELSTEEESFLTKISNEIKDVNPMSSKFFYDEEAGKSLCTDEEILYMAACINNYFDYNIFKDANILSTSNIPEILGVSNDTYTDICGFIGNAHSDNDFLIIAKANTNNSEIDEETNESFSEQNLFRAITDYAMNKYYNLADEYLVDGKEVDDATNKLLERYENVQACQVGDFIVAYSLGDNNTDEDDGEYYMNVGNEISDILTTIVYNIQNGLTNDLDTSINEDETIEDTDNVEGSLINESTEEIINESSENIDFTEEGVY